MAAMDIMTESEVRQFIAERTWTYAKTMPTFPHDYTLRKKHPDEATFEKMVMHIRNVGYKKKFGKATYIYLDVDGYCYWTMGDTLKGTILINRAKLPRPP